MYYYPQTRANCANAGNVKKGVLPFENESSKFIDDHLSQKKHV